MRSVPCSLHTVIHARMPLAPSSAGHHTLPLAHSRSPFLSFFHSRSLSLRKGRSEGVGGEARGGAGMGTAICGEGYVLPNERKLRGPVNTEGDE